NLGGYLIALARACREPMHRPFAGPEILEGIGDALQLLIDAMKGAEAARSGPTATTARLREAAEATAAALEALRSSPTDRPRRFRELESQADNLLDIARAQVREVQDGSRSEILIWAGAVQGSVRSHARDAQLQEETLADRLAALASLADEMVLAMDFQFLLDPTSKLFSIGYRVAENTLDPGRYDLLASEARLASFVAIAKGDVPPQHWFHLGRSLTPIGHGAALVSWSGSMFEYLMPMLVMSQPAKSLLDLTCSL